jgi:5-methylcytosine-specific restriction endonuclease McrA
MPKNPYDLRDIASVLTGGPEKEKPRRKPLPKEVRDQVWDRYIGATKTVGKCYCCRWRPITYRDYEVGHNRAVAKGGRDHISNLRPICKQCNRSMGTMSIERYREKYHGKKTPKGKRQRKRKPKKKKPTGSFQIPKIKLPKGYV